MHVICEPKADTRRRTAPTLAREPRACSTDAGANTRGAGRVFLSALDVRQYPGRRSATGRFTADGRRQPSDPPSYGVGREPWASKRGSECFVRASSTGLVEPRTDPEAALGAASESRLISFPSNPQPLGVPLGAVTATMPVPVPRRRGGRR